MPILHCPHVWINTTLTHSRQTVPSFKTSHVPIFTWFVMICYNTTIAQCSGSRGSIQSMVLKNMQQNFSNYPKRVFATVHYNSLGGSVVGWDGWAVERLLTYNCWVLRMILVCRRMVLSSGLTPAPSLTCLGFNCVLNDHYTNIVLKSMQFPDFFEVFLVKDAKLHNLLIC